MITVIGMGPGNIKYLTTDAVEVIQQAEHVIAFGRIAETAEQIRTPVVRVKRVEEILTYLQQNRNTAILASGDPCFYGIAEYLKKQGLRIDKIIPGLSSFQYMMAVLQKSWQHAKFISLHGRDEDIEHVKNYPLTVILTDKKNRPHSISKRLQQFGVTGRLYVGYNLSYEDECILIKNIGDDIEECGAISVVIVEHEMDSR
jgi:cobalt-precorrin-7 (C5)-methyltransferase